MEEKRIEEKIGGFIGKHIIGFAFLGGLLVGRCSMDRQYKHTLKQMGFKVQNARPFKTITYK